MRANSSTPFAPTISLGRGMLSGTSPCVAGQHLFAFAPNPPDGRGHAAGRSTATAAVRQRLSLTAASLPADLVASVAIALRWRPFFLLSVLAVGIAKFCLGESVPRSTTTGERV